ncbi:hypothetical protein IOC57_24025 [Bacillus sp. SD075]|uniref:hypothetical protein n=1 Tax=Bacillus sp. SD075 TaxID=2781732 RepID=UPI001A95B25C|nr:hypothetical protein [Bacillus sp. SD075]MBO1000792.1 hypothetical protein [Bacillus sp. SD075]
MILNKTRVSFMLFYYNSYWIEEIGGTLPNNWHAEPLQVLGLMRLGRQSAERERISDINWTAF